MTRWAMVADLRRCVGCQTCTAACKHANATPPGVQWRRVLDVEAGEFPDAKRAFVPTGCQHCDEPPCRDVCPTTATRKRADGIVTIDYDICIGCGYCVVACPYGARYLVPAGEHAPNDTPGVADKCTWCYHRISQGGRPACVEVCPVGARKFGDRNDPNDPIRTVLREREPKMLHPEYGTRPRVLYLGPSVQEA